MITYQTAYLKCFYPVEFMSALLTTSSSSTNDIAKYINNARLSGIDVLPPDINISHRGFTVDYNKNYINEKTLNKKSYARIRFGFEAIKGLGATAIKSIIDARKKNGFFLNIFHFCCKVIGQKINKKSLESIINSGGMDSFDRSRKQLFDIVEKALANAHLIQHDNTVGQINMFGTFANSDSILYNENYGNIDEWSEKEKLKLERETLGFYLSGHPLDRYRESIIKLDAYTTSTLFKAKQNELVKIVGVVSEIKERPLKNKKGKWAIINIEDNLGSIEVLCFNKNYEKVKNLIKNDEPLLFSGKVLFDIIDYDTNKVIPKLRFKDAVPLSFALIEKIKLVKISVLIKNNQLEIESILRDIYKILIKYKGIKPVEFILKKGLDYHVLLKCNRDILVNPCEEFLNEIDLLSNLVKVAII